MHALRLVARLLAASVVVTASGTSIVIRHDRPDTRYIELAASYPSAVTVLPDGSGVLVAPRFVLTAGHVARGAPCGDPRVRIGEQVVRVDRIFIHPSWSGRGSHDIALLRLEEAVDESPPAKLFRRHDELGRTVTFVGAGDTGTGLTGPSGNDEHRRAATNTVNEVDDEWIYFTFDRGDDATDLEGVSGPGDSGGPAFIDVDGVPHVAGVSVFSVNGKPGRYGTREGYTRVSTHADWIGAILDGTSGEAGITPGKRESTPDTGERMRPPRGGSPKDLAALPAGGLIADYFEAFNSGDVERYREFLAAHAAPAYLDRKSPSEHADFYHRIREETFGRVTVHGVVEESGARVVVRVAGAQGPQGDFHFTIGEERIEELMIGVIDAARR